MLEMRADLLTVLPALWESIAVLILKMPESTVQYQVNERLVSDKLVHEYCIHVTNRTL